MIDKEKRKVRDRRYYENHKKECHERSLKEAKRIRVQRKVYKQALLDIKEYIDKNWIWDGTGIDDIEVIVNDALGVK